jgi:serine/threonine protein kinase
VRVYDGAKALQGFDMVLDFPKGAGHMPRSLRSSLLSRCKHNLSNRFALARQMANATNYVHMFGFVHKGIRPENAFCFDDNASQLGPFYLIGFEHIRLADGRTNRAGESDLWKDIYKHPSRQGLYPYEDYCMQHDIYSLGVCLLEIGLWTSFVTYNMDSMPELDTKVLNIDEAQSSLSGQALKDSILKLARAELPSSMGSVYAETVVNCLTCLDNENDDFGDTSQFEDEDGILIGLKYIEKVSHAHISLDGVSDSKQVLSRLGSITV